MAKRMAALAAALPVPRGVRKARNGSLPESEIVRQALADYLRKMERRSTK